MGLQRTGMLPEMDIRARLQVLADTLPESGAVTFTRADLLAMLAGEGGKAGQGGTDQTAEDLTVQDIAERAKRSPSAVRGWIRSGQLRAYRFQGRDYRVAPEAWEAFKQAQRSGGEAKPRERSGKVDLGSWRRNLKKAG